MSSEGPGSPLFGAPQTVVLCVHSAGNQWGRRTNLISDTAKLLAETKGPAVLYSTCREIVATVTRRSPYPGTLLPTVTFIKTPSESVPAKIPSAKRRRRVES